MVARRQLDSAEWQQRLRDGVKPEYGAHHGRRAEFLCPPCISNVFVLCAEVNAAGAASRDSVFVDK